MADGEITLACRGYDRSAPIFSGEVKPKGLSVRAVRMDNVRKMFSGVFKGELDAGEFSLAELVFHVSRGNTDLVAIPVFPFRTFRHGFMFCRRDSSIKSPADLKGRKIGCPEWVQTASVWIRGLLAEEYGVTSGNTEYHTPALHHWDEGDAEKRKLPDGSVIHRLELGGRDDGEVLDSALIEGRLDAVIGARPPDSFLNGDPRVGRVLESYREVEAAYYRKTGVFPIMHALVARKEAVQRDPALPEKLFDLFVRARRVGHEQTRRDSGLSIVWKESYQDEERKFFGRDPYEYGLKKNSRVIEAFLSYCHQQGIVDRKIEPKELFSPATWDLDEQSV
jgi:4,5-dihydroxyphthalate decarboxylase